MQATLSSVSAPTPLSTLSQFAEEMAASIVKCAALLLLAATALVVAGATPAPAMEGAAHRRLLASPSPVVKAAASKDAPASAAAPAKGE
jgi:hypothetical protein